MGPGRPAADYRAMAFDLRGLGLSDSPASGYAWEPHFAADIANFISESLNEPAIVVGQALGAVVAAPVAISVGSGVRAIGMEAPPFSTFENPEAPRSRFTPFLAARRMPMDLRVETLMGNLGMDRAAATSRAETLEGSTGYRTDDLLPKLTCPALVILGDPSRGGVVDRADRPRPQRHLRDRSILEWSDVGHGIHVAQPERFIGELRGFFGTLS